MLVIQSNFSCPTCRARPGSGTASALPWVSVPRLPGCPAQKGPTGLQGAPGRKGRGATSCVSRFLIHAHTLSHGTSVNPTYFNCMYVYVRGSKHVGCRTLQLGSSGSSYTEASG